MTSSSASSSLKSTESLLADLAGRPGRRPEGAARVALTAVFAAFLAAVFLTAAFLAAVVFAAASLAAAFLAGAFLAAVDCAVASALASASTFTDVLEVLLVAAAVLRFFSACSSATNGFLPVALVIVASVIANRARRITAHIAWQNYSRTSADQSTQDRPVTQCP